MDLRMSRPTLSDVPRRMTLLVLLALLACQGEPASTTTTGATATTIATTTTGGGDPASQSPDDAARDGVIAELAALPLPLRAEVVDSSETDEGIWALSRPAPGIEPYTDDCRLGADSGRYPTDFICTTEYGEVLLLDSDSGAILRAYPFPGVPPELIVVTETAVYCARNGEGMLPDSMVCRIDRVTLEPTVMVFPGSIDSVVAQPCFYPPDHWSTTQEPLTVSSLHVDADGVWVEGVGGAGRLDPVTLEPVGSDTMGIPGLAVSGVCAP
jgi:hypothetical protein